MSKPSAPNAVIWTNLTYAIKPAELLPTTAKPTGSNIMCVLVPFNGSPPKRVPIGLMKICDEAGIERHWPDARDFWGIRPLRHTRALLVPWHDTMLQFANGLYFIFGGDVHSGLPVNKHFDRNRYGLHGDVVILKPIWDGLPGNDKVNYKHVPEELLYPATMAGFFARINDLP